MRSFALCCVLFLGCLASLSCATGTVVGGVSTSEPADDAALKAADMALNKLNSDKGLLSSTLGANVQAPLKLMTVQEVRTQVVAGINYFLTLRVTDAYGNTFPVRLTVWARPWLEASNSDDAWKVTAVQRMDA